MPCEVKSCQCSQHAHKATTVLGKPALQCSECGRITVMWSGVERAHKRDRLFLIMCLSYGSALWALGTASVVLTLRYHSDAMALGALAMTIVGIFGVRTWLFHWRNL